MDGGGLRSVLERVQRRKLAVAPKWIVYVAMRVADANDRFVIPTNNSIQETHRAGVRDESANLRFIDERSHSDTT